MKKKETGFKEEFFDDVRSWPNTWAEKIQQVGKRGTPDFLICMCGLFFGVELKTDEGETEVLQNYKLFKIEKAGGQAYVVTPKIWKNGLRKKLKAIATRGIIYGPNGTTKGKRHVLSGDFKLPKNVDVSNITISSRTKSAENRKKI